MGDNSLREELARQREQLKNLDTTFIAFNKHNTQQHEKIFALTSAIEVSIAKIETRIGHMIENNSNPYTLSGRWLRGLAWVIAPLAAIASGLVYIFRH